GDAGVSLRRRIGLIAGASVAAAVLVAALVCYLVVRDQLRSQIDTALRQQEHVIEQSHTLPSRLPRIPARAGGPAPYVPILLANGGPSTLVGNLSLPVTIRDRQIAATQHGAYMRDLYVGHDHLRVLTFPVLADINGVTAPAALQLARPLNGV